MYKKNTNILIFNVIIFMNLFLKLFFGKVLKNINEFNSPDGSKYPTFLGVDTANSGRMCFYKNEM